MFLALEIERHKGKVAAPYPYRRRDSRGSKSRSERAVAEYGIRNPGLSNSRRAAVLRGRRIWRRGAEDEVEVGKAKGAGRWDAAVDALDILKNLHTDDRLAAVRMPSCQSGKRDLGALTFRTSMIPAQMLKGRGNENDGCRFMYSSWITHGRTGAAKGREGQRRCRA